MKPTEVRNTLGAEVKQMSMDAPFGEDESGSLLDVLENHSTGSTDSGLVFNDSLKVETMRALSTLTAREREVVMMSFGIGLDNPYTLEEIGDEMGLTRERVRQIREKALQKLREPMKNRRLKEFCAS
jgi:RNA polymerase primary sigma factor